ncbi:MAG: cold-shock protein [Bradymonadales bacterium]|nr:MAG: cold-shock protein [Bradymonadales bacterium]
MVAIVKWYNRDKGYGEITDQCGRPYFFSWQDVMNRADYPRLDAGVSVSFTVSQDEINGLRRAECLAVLSKNRRRSAQKTGQIDTVVPFG